MTTAQMIQAMLVDDNEIIIVRHENTVAAMIYRLTHPNGDIGSEYVKSVPMAVCELYEKWLDESKGEE